ncbi:GtrA family protein [Bradyrhizobium sp. 4]|uniref:GtrA family protein n=1 Tax=unclassified Bradyrhizobium TaxID=2631580 RepID=UPI001FF78A7D|nr:MULTISPECIES: GtrA family protein [unclassified Bradyrhizobium]MCK1403227.1 GtrA family protein [Bradyrhizobium sp. 39]MCK1748823.1 GtrA family protein [Bradyrhizobium sp. 135]UPJ33264.1 GtrA family protein [Bradyrhizobium sp. 4]
MRQIDRETWKGRLVITDARTSETRAGGLFALVTSSSLRLSPRFGLTGATTALVYFVLTNAFVLSSVMTPVVSSVCAYVVSVAISYLMQSRFTFRVDGDSLDQVARFVVMSLVGLVVSWGVMALTVDLLHWPYLIGAIGVCVIIPVLNFFLTRGWVFGTRGRRERIVATGDSE